MKNTKIRRIIAIALAIAMVAFVGVVPSTYAEETTNTLNGTAMYRLYCNSTGEHLYTADTVERDALVASTLWVYEGIGWVAPSTGNPVYRLFNTVSNEHLYTKDAYEKSVLEEKPEWNYEGVAWYTKDDSECNTAVYRLYHPLLPGISSHHYTLDENERDVLVQDFGWQFEGTAWIAEHNTQLEYKVDATCTEHGYTGDLVCKQCGKIVSEGAETDVNDNHVHLTHHPAEGGSIIHHIERTQSADCGICGTTITEVQTDDAWYKKYIEHLNTVHGYNFVYDESGEHAVLDDKDDEYYQLLDNTKNIHVTDTGEDEQIGGTKEWWECKDCGKKSLDKINWSYTIDINN